MRVLLPRPRARSPGSTAITNGVRSGFPVVSGTTTIIGRPAPTPGRRPGPAVRAESRRVPGRRADRRPGAGPPASGVAPDAAGGLRVGQAGLSPSAAAGGCCSLSEVSPASTAPRRARCGDLVTASSRIARISASVLCPCLSARIRRARYTASGTCRTDSVTMVGVFRRQGSVPRLYFPLRQTSGVGEVSF